MRVLIIGASGVIGGALAERLRAEHTVVTASRSHGDHRVDLADPASIRRLFEAVGPLDAIVCTAGDAVLRPVDDLTDADFERALRVQLMGQIDVFRFGRARLAPGGAVVLTSGEAARRDFPGAAAVAMACAGLERFVAAAATETTGVRLNVVSPTVVAESLAALGWPTTGAVSAAATAEVYVSVLQGDAHGRRVSVSEALRIVRDG